MKTRVEQRIRYVRNDQPKSYFVHTYGGDDWNEVTVDGVVNYPWFMNNHIVWVEERIVYEPEPWEVSPDLNLVFERYSNDDS